MAEANAKGSWADRYSDRALRSLGIPGFARSDPEEGIHRHLLLTLDDLPVGRKGKAAAPFDVICCDVLWISGEITLTRDTYIFARRIEISSKARLVVDRTDGDFGFWLVAQQIGDRQSSAARALAVRVFWFDDTGEPKEENDAVQAVSDQGAIAVALPPGKTRLDAAYPNRVAEVFMRRGEELPLCLNTQFLYAALVFTDDARLVARILGWIAALVQGSEDFADLSVEAKALCETATKLARNTSAILVPTLDHSVYAEASQQCLALLQQRQERYQQLQALTRQDKNWRQDAATAFADRQNEANLYESLEKQAQATREQAEQARWLATMRIRDDVIDLDRRQHAFETGIEAWKRKQTQDAIIDLVVNAVKLLAELPAIVTGSPAALDAVKEIGGGAVSVLTAIAKGEFDPIPSKLKTWVSQASDKANAKGSLDDWTKLKQAETPPKRLALVLDDEDDVSPVILGRDESPLILDDDVPQIKLDDDDLLRPEKDDGDPPPVVGPSVDDLLAEFEVVKDDPDAEKWAKARKEQEKADKATKAAREKKKQEFVSAIKGAAGAAKGIYDSAMRINAIAATAEAMEKSSTNLLVEVEAGVRVALSGIDLQGIATVTGGSDDWDKMVLSIEDMFESFADGALMGVGGAHEYRKSFRTLMIDGKAQCQARLALAKANADLAAAKVRRGAADRAVALFKARADALDAEVLSDEVYQQAAFERVVEAKRGVFLALEAYRRAFAYFTLQPEDKLPALPRITESVDVISRAVRAISGRKLVSETISDLYGAPSTLDGVEVRLADPAVLEEFCKDDGVATLTIDVGNPGFAAFRRVRLGEIRVYLDGLAMGAKPTIRIHTSGVYNDKRQSKVGADGAGQNYVTRPESKIFAYEVGNDRPIARADIAARYANDFFRPTPFTTWRFQLARDAGPVPSLDGLSGIRVQFFGEYSP